MNSEHHDDAESFYNILSLTGCNPLVYILTADGRRYFVAYYGGCYLQSDLQFESNGDRIFAAFVAAGLVSTETSWSSSDVIVLFEDYAVSMSTSAARTMVSRYEYPLLLKYYPNYSDMMYQAGVENWNEENGFVENQIERELTSMDEYRGHSPIEPQEWAIGLCASEGYPERIYLSVDEAIELGYYMFYRDYCWRASQNTYYDVCQSITGMNILRVDDLCDYQHYPQMIVLEPLWLADYPSSLDIVCRALDEYVMENTHMEVL